MIRPGRLLLVGLAFLGVIGTSVAAAAETFVIRISTENTADHIQTKAVARFAAELQRRAKGRLTVSHHFDAALFRDRDVVKALRQGKVEMAVPGTWQLDRLEPATGIFLLPAFYGRVTTPQDRPLRDGAIGQQINQRLEALDVHVLGRWIDLGHAHVFGVRRTIRTHADLAGLKVRVAGGEANLRRLVALGAAPRVIPWTDLPQAMDEGTVDGILSTYETIASARLWEKGVTSVFEDSQYFPNYVPLVAASFWRRLPEDLRALMTEVWEDGVNAARAEAAEAQQHARTECARHGIQIVTPSPAEQAAQRRRLLSIQTELTEVLGIDAALVSRAMALLGEEP